MEKLQKCDVLSPQYCLNHIRRPFLKSGKNPHDVVLPGRPTFNWEGFLGKHSEMFKERMFKERMRTEMHTKLFRYLVCVTIVALDRIYWQISTLPATNVFLL
jgi:hypothetical protein